VPEPLDRWRKARAEISHDWLERRLLSVLNTPGDSPDDFARRARLCNGAWNSDILPRLELAVAQLPACMLPGLLLDGWLGDSVITSLNLLALDSIVGEGFRLGDAATNLRRRKEETQIALENYARSPQDASRQRAFTKVMALRSMLQQLPRNVILP